MTNECYLRVTLDQPERTFHPNEQITGTVHVHVSGDCHCRGLTVTRKWATHGKGTPTDGSKHKEILFRGDWVEAGQYSYPFSLPLPHGPFSYQGELLNVAWYIVCEADIAWDLDPHAQYTFLLKPGATPIDEPYRGGSTGSGRIPGEQRINSNTGGQNGTGIVLALVSALLLIYAIVGAIGIPMDYTTGVTEASGDPTTEVAVATSFLLSLFFAWLVYYVALRDFLADRALGEVVVRIDNHRVSPGDDIDVEVYIPPASKVHLHLVQMTLSCVERVDYQPGADTTITTSAIRRVVDIIETIPDSIEQPLAKGEAVAYRSTFTIPEDAPYSFAAYQKSIQWSVIVDIDIKKWRNWNGEIPLEVVPPQRSQLRNQDLPNELNPGISDSGKSPNRKISW